MQTNVTQKGALINLC